jgi:Zn-dependent M28 family amino/carboxypeptidase
MAKFFKPRRIVGMTLVATAFVWVQVAGYFEGQRIDEQRAGRQPASARPEALRVDSESLMTTVRTLTEPRFEGRATGTPGNLAARAWIEERFKTIGLSPVSGSYVFPFHFTHVSIKAIIDPERQVKTEYAGANVVGQCAGTDGKLPVYLMSAHFDHLGIRGGVMYPGADDNASGIAVLMAVAEYCKRTPFAHTVVFAAFDAEELGLQGSRAFLIAPPVPKERIALNVNLDMVSRSDRRELFVAGPYHWPQIKVPLEQVAMRAPITLLFGHDKPMAVAGGVEDWTTQSDHGSFHAAKIPFVYFGVEDHADYHKPTDTADKIDRGFFVDVAETVLEAMLQLDLLDLRKP